jgi:hypothetical protein
MRFLRWLKNSKEKMEMKCRKCSNDLRRIQRESFMQREVYPLFGYYPWECPLCREPLLIKKRYLGSRRSRHRKHSV